MSTVDIKSHSKKCEEIFSQIVKNKRFKGNSIYAKNTEYKLRQYDILVAKLNKVVKKGSVFKEYLKELDTYRIEMKDLLDNIDEKFLLFVVGTGNYGKSSLINALMGESIAPIDFRPKTWKIDVYYLDEKNKKNAIIKLNDGETLYLSNEEAKKFIDEEENKISQSLKEFNKIKNVELKKCTTREERDEMKEKLQKEYLYRSKVVEVRWPVEKNKFLKNIQLVDTPGIMQDDLDLKNSIKDYYFKADGVIWLLDASTISSKNNQSMIDELEECLKDLGGINDNIIGVVNKIDKVEQNGGQEAVDLVLGDANKFFGDKFKYILPISAKEALEDQNNHNLLVLNETIENTFISDANAVKLQSKMKGIEKIAKDSVRVNNEFLSFVEEKNSEYQKRVDYIESFKIAKISEIESELSEIIRNHTNKVEQNVALYTDNLFEIKDKNSSKSYVTNTIFELNSLQKKLELFIENKIKSLDTSSKTVYDYVKISKYKYISKLVSENTLSNIRLENLNLKITQNFNIYTSLGEFSGDGIIDFLGGAINKLYKGIMKMVKINSVKENLINSMNEIANSARTEVMNSFNSNIGNISKNSTKILNESYENILFKYEYNKYIKNSLDIFEEDCAKEIKLTLKDLI